MSRVRYFAWSIPICGVAALLSTGVVLHYSGDGIRHLLRAYPVLVVASLFGSLIGLFVAISQLVFRVRLTRIGGRLVYTEKQCRDDRGGGEANGE